MSQVEAVHVSPTHSMTKYSCASITLTEGYGVEGDAHAGATVQHRSRVRQDPGQPNLRQVHLIHRELFDELRMLGFDVTPGYMGENITTRDLDLLALPAAARLHIGAETIVEITGLRNPCTQLDDLQDGLMAATLDRNEDGTLIRKAGVMSIVVAGGIVRPGDAIEVEMPPPPFRRLDRV